MLIFLEKYFCLNNANMANLFLITFASSIRQETPILCVHILYLFSRSDVVRSSGRKWTDIKPQAGRLT